MATDNKTFLSRYKIPLLVLGGILVLGMLAVAIFAFIIPSINRSETQGQTNPPLVDAPSDEIQSETVNDQTSGLPVTLSSGQAQPQESEPVPVGTSEPLTDEEIEQILVRLPSLLVDSADQVDFNLPPESLPPPRTGETIEETFPPDEVLDVPEPVDAGPLEVLRFAPEGEIPLAPFVNITFNQPMVPLGTLDDLAAEEVPVRLEPALPGTWRWLGTKTLTFQFDSTEIDRLPMATEYVVTIPAGTESFLGATLAETVSWTFSTPPPEIVTQYPDDIPQPLDPLFFIAFDQRIEPAAVLETIEVTAGNQKVELKLATEAEVNEEKTVARLAENAQEGRWLAFKSQELLPPDSPVSVTIGPGTPSAEGPVVTDEAQFYSFHTYAPLRIEDHGCAWADNECRPLTPFFIRFNNPLDVDNYDDSMLTISPELPGATVNIFGDTINIRGASEGQTTYRITLSGDIQDVFGQKLGRDETITIRVGPAEPILIGPQGILVTLDPAAEKPSLSLYTINYNRLEVKVYQVEPSDWPEFKEYLREYQRTDVGRKPPGRLVLDENMRLETPADVLTEVNIDLSEVMEGDYGHFVVVVKPPKGIFEQERYWETVNVWVQVTQIGLDAFADHSQMTVWTTALKDGTPLADVSITSDPGGVKETTSEDGTARFAIPAAGAQYLIASLGEDRAILPRSANFWGDDAWVSRPPNDLLRWYVFDDRQIYKPGEEVSVKGWLRRIGGGQDGDVSLVGSGVDGVRYQVIGPQGNELGNDSSQVNALGGFDFTFTLPDNANLGYAQLILNAEGNLGGMDGSQYYHQFQILEFRRPEFEVAARNETEGPYFAGEHAIVAVEANYYAGGPLPNAEVSWLVSSTPTNYSPPNWPDFHFGIWQPWWWYYEPMMSFEGPGPFGAEQGEVETFEGLTDASGNHFLRLDFDEPGEARPYSLFAEATVFDVNRQAWSGGTSLLVHPGELYVGIRSERIFVERGDPLKIEFIVTDLDGNPVVDRPVKITAARLEWKYNKGDWREEEVDLQECTKGSEGQPVTCTFETPVGGRYQITAEVTDQMGRKNQSQFTRWVSGGERPPSRRVELETVTLIPDKESYQPGDTAQILVQAPFSPAEGMLTVSRSGTLYDERFEMSEESITLEVPIEESFIPNLHLQVDLVGSAPRLDDQGEEVAGVPPRPAYASGQLQLSIPPAQRTLDLKITPRETELEPGGETLIDLELKDARGEPVPGAELAVVVVDEAVLALSNYQLADPISVFYQNRSADLSSTYGRASIVLVDPLALDVTEEVEGEALRSLSTQAIAGDAIMEAPAAAPMEEAGGAAGAPAQVIQIRTDFNPLATFAPEVRTDANGRARVEISLPDNLTRYRVMVVAVDDGNQFGSGEANLTARLPLMVRPSAPRFLNFGDKFELPVVLQNQTDEEMIVDVVVQAANIRLPGSAGERVTVPANDRVEVRFPAVTDMAGTARFQVAAVSGDFADAAVIELPVYTPATTEAFATYGVIDEGSVIQPVSRPRHVFPQFGGLEIDTSSTALQALTDAVLYLVSYPYECTEQIASRILAVAALRDVLSAFSAEGLPSPEEMEAAVVRDIEQLQGLQNFDGGFPYWRRGQDSIPFNTIHAAHALQRARQMDFAVPEEMWANSLAYLRDIESHYPSYYGRQTRQTLSAYALYVRYLMGDRDVDKARRLLNEDPLEELPLEAIAWIWQVLIDDPQSTDDLDAIREFVNNRIVETAGAANFITSFDDQAYLLLNSNRRTDALFLDAMIADDPGHDLIPKLVNGLLANRTRGRWSNTQENVFILLALDRYFNTFEAETPEFVARMWLGDTYIAEHEYIGRTTDRIETNVPMTFLVDSEQEIQDLILSKDGQGRLYYRLGLSYAPTDLELDPLDMGFVVQRSYEAVDDPDDVTQDENGIWHIKAGARVRVRLQMVADNRRYHVALVDPLPAGLEIINPSLAVSGSVPQDPNQSDYHYGWWWWGTWYEHQNMRDERAEAFTTLLWDGVYNYSYVARATTPGVFTVPPAKAEEMYSPEVFGRSASDWVIVE
ncbi:MAG: alpha-2-macroglobulin family protein [Anaerolineales bacterium]